MKHIGYVNCLSIKGELMPKPRKASGPKRRNPKRRTVKHVSPKVEQMRSIGRRIRTIEGELGIKRRSVAGLQRLSMRLAELERKAKQGPLLPAEEQELSRLRELLSERRELRKEARRVLELEVYIALAEAKNASKKERIELLEEAGKLAAEAGLMKETWAVVTELRKMGETKRAEKIMGLLKGGTK
jgi:hypothetical protein